MEENEIFDGEIVTIQSATVIIMFNQISSKGEQLLLG